MKVTTVRFGTDLWRLLEAEASYAGVSVSQYIREAALRETLPADADAVARAEAERVLAGLARLTAAGVMRDANALRAQAEQAQARHKKVHESSASAVRRRRT